MSDDRMDERLRDYAARWTAARPTPSVSPASVVRDGRRASWLPYAAAATVIALVAGVAYAVAPRRDRAPVAAPTLSPAPPAPPSYDECGEEDVTSEWVLKRDDNAGTVDLTLDVKAKAGPCTLPNAPVVEIRGDDLKDLGITSRYSGDDVPVVLTSQPRRLAMTWSPPFCHKTTIVVAVVMLTEHVGFKQPIERSRVPKCHGLTGESVLRARWEPRKCATGDWQVASATLRPVSGWNGDAVEAVVVLRNVSIHFCEMNLKPFLVVHAADGRTIRLSHVQNSDLRHEPGLPPGGLIRARVEWASYCGADLGAYRTEIVLHPATLAFDPGARPVPPCVRDAARGSDGLARSEWVTREAAPAG